MPKKLKLDETVISDAKYETILSPRYFKQARKLKPTKQANIRKSVPLAEINTKQFQLPPVFATPEKKCTSKL